MSLTELIKQQNKVFRVDFYKVPTPEVPERSHLRGLNKLLEILTT